MGRLVIDSWGWIEYLQGSPAGVSVQEKILDERNEIYTHIVSVAEIISKAKRSNQDAEVAWKAVTSSKVVSSDANEAREVGLLHAKVRLKRPNFGLADTFVLHLARRLEAKVLTGDPDFRGMDEVIFIS